MINKKIETAGKRYPLAEARKIAEGVVEELRPFCSRIEIVGSLRRARADVGDIDILAIALPYSVDPEDGLAKAVSQWTRLSGKMKYGSTKNMRFLLPSGIKVDIYFAGPENYGLIKAIRTGSANYSHHTIMNSCIRAGYRSIDGYLTKNGQRVEVREEADLFRMIGVPYIEPEFRNL